MKLQSLLSDSEYEKTPFGTQTERRFVLMI